MKVLIALSCAILLLAQQTPVETAWNLLAKGQRQDATRLLHDFLKDHPSDADARLLLGSILAEDGDRSGAIGQLTEAVRLRPRSAEAHNALGEALNGFGDAKTARVEFEKTLAIDPAFAPAHVGLGQILIESHDLAGAAQHLDRALQLLGTSHDAAYPHYLRAKIDSERHQLQQSAQHLNIAVSLQPDFTDAWSDLAQVRKSLEDSAGALAAFQRAAETAPDDAAAQYRLGSEYLRQKQSHLAVLHLQKSLSLKPDDQPTLYALQMALRQDGQLEAASEAKEKLAALLRRRDEASEKDLAAVQLNNQGVELEKAGNLRGALKKYRDALALSPDHVGFRVNYAAALLHLGERNEGVAQLRDAIRRDPENKELKKALEKALAAGTATK
jgi:tetratricopeptide (TPR) repeat protein